mgnify:FL=1
MKRDEWQVLNEEFLAERMEVLKYGAEIFEEWERTKSEWARHENLKSEMMVKKSHLRWRAQMLWPKKSLAKFKNKLVVVSGEMREDLMVMVVDEKERKSWSPKTSRLVSVLELDKPTLKEIKMIRTMEKLRG